MTCRGRSWKIIVRVVAAIVPMASDVTSWAQSTDVSPLESPLPAPPQTVVRERESHEMNSGATGFALFLGIDGGISRSMNSPRADVLADKQGVLIGGKMVASLIPESWVFDLGLGWLHNTLEGEEAIAQESSGSPSNGSDSRFKRKSVKVITGAGFVEFSPRYRLTRNWQVGAVTSLLMGDDVSLSSAPDAKQNLAVFVGAQIMYGIPEKTADLRYGFQVLTDIDVEDGQHLWVTASIQMGLPIVKPDTLLREREMLTTRERLERREVPRYVPKVVYREVVKFVFENHALSFEPGKADLSPESQSFLLELAGLLQQHNDKWTLLTVEGHVDNTAEARTNARLSTARAYAVRAALVSGGLAGEKVRHLGFGTSRPVDPADKNALSPRNSRIELSFSGASDPKGLNDAINRLRLLKNIPETCGPQGCR